MPEPVGAGGIQDNLSVSTHPGLNNPDLTGNNMYYALGPLNGGGDWSVGTPGLLTGITTLSVNGTSCTGSPGNTAAVCSITASGSPQLLELTTGYVSPGIVVTVDTGGNQETVATLSGANVIGMIGVFTKSHTAPFPVTYNAGGFTLANGMAKNTSDYNYAQYMPTISMTATGAPIALCSAHPVSLAIGGNDCGSGINQGPDHWEFEDLIVKMSPGNANAAGGLVYAGGGSGQGPDSQFAHDIHLRRIGGLGDWTSLSAGANEPSHAFNFNGCSYCSLVGSQTSQLLRPSAEGHAVWAQGVSLKIVNNWFESQSSGIFSGGDSNPPTPATFIGLTDGEIGQNRETFPYSWLGFQCVVSGGSTEGDQTGTSGCFNVPSDNTNWAGKSIVRKNAQEFKTAKRVVVYGNIRENVDNSGGQHGPIILLNVRNASGSAANATNYNSIITDVTESGNIQRNGCEGRQNAARSDGAGSGNGVAYGMRNVNVIDSLDYNITSNGPGCAAVADGITLGSADQTWTGTVTCPDTSHCTFVAAASVDSSAPLSTAANTISSLTIAASGTSPLTLTAAANASGGNTAYTGTITGGGSNALVGDIYNITGFTNNANDGMFTVTASTTTTLTLNNSIGVAETHAGIATGLWKTSITTTASNPFVVGEHVGITGLTNSSDSGCFTNLNLTVTATGNPVTASLPTHGGCTAGTYTDSGNVSGPIGYHVLDMVAGNPVYLAGCTTTFFNGPTTTIGGHTVAGLGYPITTGSTAWGTATGIGGYPVPTPSNFSVTFALTNTGQSDSSGTCTITNIQGNPSNFTFNHLTFVTDSDTAFGTGANLSSLPNPPFPCVGGASSCGSGQIFNHAFTNSIIFSQNGASQAGLYNTNVGEGYYTEKENYDTSSLTFDYLVWVGRSSKQSFYYELGNNPNVPDTNGCTCSGSGCLSSCIGGSSAPSLFFPANSCTALGTVNACGSSVVPLTLSDYHGYGLGSGSSYHNAASDSTDIGARIPNIDAAQTETIYVCPYYCGGNSGGPFPK
jgi:hypothetical protein